MGIATGMTSEAMRVIADASVVAGSVNSSGSLILQTRGGVPIDAGSVRGPQGVAGVAGTNGGTAAARDAVYGVPTSDSARLALALKQAIWWNSDQKWFETYTVPANFTNKPTSLPGGYSNTAGWFPIPMPLGDIGYSYVRTTTGMIDSGVSGWRQPDFVTVNVVAGRKYRVKYKVTHSSNAANMALAVECYREPATNSTNVVRGGFLTDDQWTLYVAPFANQGKTDIIEFVYVADKTERVRFKIAVLRATLSGTWQMERRWLQVFDDGA